MGFIRSILFICVSILLFLSLLIGNLFLTLSWSLEFETVKPEITNYIQNLVNDLDLFTKINNDFNLMNNYCENNSEYVFTKGGYTFVIPCEVVMQGSEKMLEYSIANLVTQIYYQEYNCNFWDCVKLTDKPFFLISKTAKDYWGNKFYFILIIIISLIILGFLLAEQKSNFIILLGALMIISALPFMKISALLSFISPDSIINFLPIFFVRSYNVFLIMFILGIGLLIFGITLKFFAISFKLTNFFYKVKDNTSENEIKTKDANENSDTTKSQDLSLQKELLKDLVGKEIKQQLKNAKKKK